MGYGRHKGSVLFARPRGEAGVKRILFAYRLIFSVFEDTKGLQRGRGGGNLGGGTGKHRLMGARNS
jgi:hypothetical protein